MGTVIISPPNSPMLFNKTPRTVSMYLMGNGTVLGLTDLPINTQGLTDCGGAGGSRSPTISINHLAG
ncbi:hypothetical protein [Vulcanisaeta souniana]|uniref:hypothetical protein n=1 Tax=Vulcanisaeta souniana TaxID=164452 RepID=UPI000A3F7382|nr:hypothetical protein [Vulcanisaeta souniana]